MKKLYKFFILFIIITICLFLSACSDTESTINLEIIAEESNSYIQQPNEEIADDDESVAPEGGEVQSENESHVVADNYSKYILVKVNGLNVRSGAGTQYSSICSFNFGDMLGYIGLEDGWYKTTVRGKIGYVSANDKYTSTVCIKKGSENVENIISIALKYLGTPYVYGATRYHNGNGVLLSGFSTDAFDCSSFMQYAFFVGNGNLLGLTTRNQVLQGVSVSKKNIERGDLLFFTNATRYNNTGLNRVGHVALYLGDNYILHTASDYAVIEQISTTRWGYYLEARRMAE